MHPNGSRYWRLKYRYADKEKVLALGVYPKLTVAIARERAEEARALMGDGGGANPYPVDTAEHHCRAHGWRDESYEIDAAIEALKSGGPDCFGLVVDGRGRVLAEARPAG